MFAFECESQIIFLKQDVLVHLIGEDAKGEIHKLPESQGLTKHVSDSFGEFNANGFGDR